MRPCDGTMPPFEANTVCHKPDKEILLWFEFSHSNTYLRRKEPAFVHDTDLCQCTHKINSGLLKYILGVF